MERKLFYNHRPLKIGYLIDVSVSSETIKDVILYNLSVRGGRYYQFFLLDNDSGKQSISNIDLKRMESYDADVYICLCEIEKQIKDYIIIKFSPFDILDTSQTSIQRGYIRLDGDRIRMNPVSLVPHKKLVEKLGFGKLVVFLIDENLSSDTRQFINDFIGLNFGYFENLCWHLKGYDKCYLDMVEHEVIKIESISDILTFFINVDHKSYIYPNQLSHLPYNSFGRLNSKSEDIYLVVGNSLKDYINFWNRNVYSRSWKANFLNTFFFPIDAFGINDKEIIESFLKFIYQCSQYQNQNGSKPSVVLVSSTFTEEELLGIKLNGHSLRVEADLDIYENADFTNHKQPIDGWRYVCLYEESNVVRLDKEDLWRTGMVNQLYVTDAFLEYQKSEYVMTSNGYGKVSLLEYNRNNNAIHGVFSNRTVRVNRNHSFSILFDKGEGESWMRSDNYSENKFELGVTFPSRYSVISSVMMMPYLGNIGDINNRSFKELDQSAEGKKQTAIINLCKGNLHFLESVLNDKRWRELLIKHTQIFNKELTEKEIKATLVSHLNSNIDYLTEKIYKRAFKTINIVKENYISLNQIIKEFGISEIDRPKNELEEISDTLEALREVGIIRQGIEFECKYCGDDYRVLINEVKEEMKCRGCGLSSNIPINPERSYAFNSILKGSDAKGTFAVLHFLTKLGSFSSESFMYSLGVKCMDKDKSLGECDIVCLKNGKLVLCEIKYNRKGVYKSDFDKMMTIAGKVKPDKIIFASYDKPTEHKEADLKKRLNEAKEDLAIYGTTIECVSIESYYLH